ncbi:hypothetical protein Tco_1333513, partial [Tanacetum coccineum]
FGRRFLILDCFNLGRVNVNSLAVNHVPKKLHGVDENIIDEHYHKFIQIVPAFLEELIYKVLGLLVPLLELNLFEILLGEPEEGRVGLQEKLPEIL